jgi:uncharacterized protein YpuA (DUF1002 family)
MKFCSNCKGETLANESKAEEKGCLKATKEHRITKTRNRASSESLRKVKNSRQKAKLRKEADLSEEVKDVIVN